MQATSQPTRLAQYEIKGTLAQGQTWRVYKAYDPGSGREVALKVIPKQVLSSFSDDMSARFQAEARAAAGLNHPGIVKVYEYGEDAAFAFLAMEYVEGWRLRERFRVPTNDAINLIAQVLDALAYAHGKEIVHREINPSNLVLSREGHLRITNFGVVRLGSGAPGYLAPEQFMGLNVDHRCDIFSCGVILYELLTGLSPFPGPPEEMAARVCNEKEKPPSEINSNVSRAFDRICARALAKSVNERYADARTFRDDVRRANLETDAGLSPPVVSNETIVAHASFKPQPDRQAGAPSRSITTPTPPAKTSPVPFPVSQSASHPQVAASAAATERDSKPLAILAKPVSARKGLAPDIAARLEELVGKSPDSLAGYYEDSPCPPEKMIHAFVATVQALISVGPANCSSETLGPQSIRFDPIGKATISSKQDGVQASPGFSNPRYAAPETISEKAAAADPNSAAAHVYALGMMFYEISLGKQLFEKTFANQRTDLSWLRWQADLESKPAPLKSLLPECPVALSDVIESMMEKHVEKRQADLNTILSQLRDIARRSNKTVVLRKATPPAKLAPKPAATSDGRSPWARLLVFLIVVVLGGAILFAVWQNSDLYRAATSLWTRLMVGLRHLLNR